MPSPNQTRDMIEAQPRGGVRKVINITAARTLLKNESGSIVTNLGAAGAVTASLPQDATVGDNFTFAVMVAQELRAAPGASGGVYIATAKQSDNKYVTANAISESVTLVADGNGDWFAVGESGTWTAEA